MKKLSIILITIIILSFQAYALTEVDISLYGDDSVAERFRMTINSDDYYDSFIFTSQKEPYAVSYDEGYYIEESEEGYKIIFEKDIIKGQNVLEFTLLYDNLVEKSGKDKVFRSTFSTGDDILVTLNLPEKHILSSEPSVIPTPIDITTDGKKITINWDLEDGSTVAVFYEGTGVNYLLIIILILFSFMSIALVRIYTRKKIKTIVDEMTSIDEKLVMKELDKGIVKQNEIAKNLDFSKSKMSKVIRKLEEKGLISKEPYFKTNKLKRKK